MARKNNSTQSVPGGRNVDKRNAGRPKASASTAKQPAPKDPSLADEDPAAPAEGENPSHVLAESTEKSSGTSLPLLNSQEPPDRTSRKRGAPAAKGTGVDGSPKKKKLLLSFSELKPGVLLTLGENDVGQLGLGLDVPDKSHPTIVPGIPEPVAVAVAGGMHTACITVSGKVYTFGCNDEGALGRLTADSDAETIPGEVNLPERVVQVSAGDSHTAVLSETGRVYAWGTFRDANGSMGLHPGGPEKCPVLIVCERDKQIVKIASGSDHLVCLTSDGIVYTAGCAEQGQLGRVAECFAKRDNRKGPSLLLTLQAVHFRPSRKHPKPILEDIWAGTYVTFAKAKGTGDIYAWGLNNYYQLGLPEMNNRYIPELVTALPGDRDWKDIAGGQHHTVAVDRSGAVFSIGRGTYGQLGLGQAHTSDVMAPTRIDSLAAQHCIRVAASSSVSFAVTKTGKAFAWGMGTSKQLGGTDEDDVLQPREMRGKQLEGKEVISISSGGQHTVILLSDVAVSTK